MRVLRIAALAAALLPLLVGVSESRASSAGVLGGTLSFGANPGEVNDVTIALEGSNLRVRDPGAGAVMALSGCMPSTGGSVLCPAGGITKIGASLGDGDDRLTVDASVPASVAAQLQGNEGVDLIIGGAGNDELLGMSGGDTLRGAGGDDSILEPVDDFAANTIEGGPGQDEIVGGGGPDMVSGGPGDDRTLVGMAGNDLIDGGEGDDLLDAGSGPLPFEPDSDVLVGGSGTDRAQYAARADPLRVSLGDGANDGVSGENDDVTGDIEHLTGSEGNDELIGGPGGDAIDGAGGADVIDGGPGDDRLDGGTDAGADTLGGGSGADLLDGGAGDDRLDGGSGDDRLAGSDGSDRLGGNAGDDQLDAGPGDDELDGGAEADRMSGGEGTDTVLYGERNGVVEVTIDGEANDGEVTRTRFGRERLAEGATSKERDNVDTTNERVTATPDADTVSGDSGPNLLEGAAGEDYLDARAGADTLGGGGSNDTIFSRDGARDRVSCGSGYDYVVADRRDLVPRLGAGCEYVDDGSRSRPRARLDMAVRPRCGKGDDAEVSPPGTRRLVPVAAKRVLAPFGTGVDPDTCSVGLTVATRDGRTLTGSLGSESGRLRIGQRRAGGGLLTTMRPTDCKRPRAARSEQAEASKYRRPKHRRTLGRIAFPVELKVDAAVMTKRSGVASWSVTDLCGISAVIRVESGRLAVLNLGTDRRVVLGPGDPPYTAKAP